MVLDNKLKFGVHVEKYHNPVILNLNTYTIIENETCIEKFCPN